MSTREFLLMSIRPTLGFAIVYVCFLPALHSVQLLYSSLSQTQVAAKRYYNDGPALTILTLAFYFPVSVLLPSIFCSSIIGGLPVWIWFTLIGVVAATFTLMGLFDRVVLHAPFYRDAAPDSSIPALRDLARRHWLFGLNSGIVAISGSLILVVRTDVHLRHFEAGGASALATLVGYVVLLFAAVAMGYLAWHVTGEMWLLFQIGAICRGARQLSLMLDSGLLIRPTGGARRALVGLTRELRRQSRRIGRASPSHPFVAGFLMASYQIRDYLNSPKSLGSTIEPWVINLAQLCGDVIGGGCHPMIYHEFLVRAGAITDEGEMVILPDPHQTRLRRIANAVIGGVEPTNQLLATAAKVAGAILIAVLVISGNLGLSELIDKLIK